MAGSLEALTEYTQETWGFSVELIIYQLIEKDNLELEKEVVQSCLSEDIDIFTAQLSQRSVIDMESFIDLGQEPYCEELDAVLPITRRNIGSMWKNSGVASTVCRIR